MKFKVLFLAFTLLTPSSVYASTTTNNVTVQNNSGSSEVKIHNNVNTSSSTTVSEEGNTKVYIEQSGEGTSQVNINGKEWKLEGPGKIDVNESSSNSNNYSTAPTSKPTKTITPTPNDDNTTPTPTKTQKDPPNTSFIFEDIRNLIRRIFAAFGL